MHCICVTMCVVCTIFELLSFLWQYNQARPTGMVAVRLHVHRLNNKLATYALTLKRERRDRHDCWPINPPLPFQKLLDPPQRHRPTNCLPPVSLILELSFSRRFVLCVTTALTLLLNANFPPTLRTRPIEVTASRCLCTIACVGDGIISTGTREQKVSKTNSWTANDAQGATAFQAGQKSTRRH